MDIFYGRGAAARDAEDYLAFARRVNATSAILLAYLVSKAICLTNPDMDKPVVCSMAADMRRELGLPHTHKNCVRSMYLPFEREDAAREPREVCTRYRASIAQQRQVEYVKQTANSFLGMNDRLDQLKTLEEKKAMMSFFDTMTVNSYVLSYLGAFDLGECDPFIDAIHFYSGGIRGITVNMTHAGGRFNNHLHPEHRNGAVCGDGTAAQQTAQYGREDNDDPNFSSG